VRIDPNNLPEDACQLCGTVRLSFEPPPLYCTPCGARIKRNGIYHFVMAGTDTKHVVCTQCFVDQRGDTVDIEGHQFPKSKLEKRKNDEEVEEAVGFRQVFGRFCVFLSRVFLHVLVPHLFACFYPAPFCMFLSRDFKGEPEKKDS
jgi:hypothetical protein